jgi:hypothetical protein
MGTKNNPGQFDCYANALPDEPMFVLLARDPTFHRLVSKWASYREEDIIVGERPWGDFSMVREARETATTGGEWRRENNGIWRKT